MNGRKEARNKPPWETLLCPWAQENWHILGTYEAWQNRHSHSSKGILLSINGQSILFLVPVHVQKKLCGKTQGLQFATPPNTLTHHQSQGQRGAVSRWSLMNSSWKGLKLAAPTPSPHSPPGVFSAWLYCSGPSVTSPCPFHSAISLEMKSRC